jgi:hypothetical protein
LGQIKEVDGTSAKINKNKMIINPQKPTSSEAV